MKINILSTLAGVVSLGLLTSAAAEEGNFGLIGFELDGLTTTVAQSTSTGTTTVYYSTIVSVTTRTLTTSEFVTAAIGKTTLVRPETLTLSSTYVTTVPSPGVTTKYTTSYLSTTTITAGKSGATGGASNVGFNGYLAIAAGAGVLALV